MLLVLLFCGKTHRESRNIQIWFQGGESTPEPSDAETERVALSVVGSTGKVHFNSTENLNHLDFITEFDLFCQQSLISIDA